MDLRKEKIKAEALRLGFSFIGFTQPRQTPHFSAYENWINVLLADELGYLQKKYVIDARKDPGLILAEARAVIVLGLAYPIPNLPNTASNSESNKYGQIAAYACLPDYHRWFKERTGELMSFLKAHNFSSGRMKFFVDSGPVMEKDFAYQAGLGWIGKNSLFISAIFGSFCLLGCLFLDLDLEPDITDGTDLCGECDLCIRSCPTQAISDRRTISANRCISFLTTSFRGNIPAHLCEKIGDHLFGCDICQEVCPLNKGKNIFNYDPNKLISPKVDNQVHLLNELLLSDRSYSAKYSLTPIGKLPHDVFQRNLMIALGNSGERSFIEPLKKMIKAHSSSGIQAAADWAIASLEA